MRWESTKTAVLGVYVDVNANHTMAFAAGLSYYLLLSMFPLLIFLAAVLAYLPIPNLFNAILDLMARFVPGEAMTLVRQIVVSIMSPPHSGLVSVGFLGTIWAASGGFASLIEGLNVAYDVLETRAIWKTRLLAIALTFVVGGLIVVGLSFTLLGPRFGDLLKEHHHAGPLFAFVWPAIRWSVIVVTVVLAIEILYYMAPNVKQRFWATLPGALLAVISWVAISQLLGIYVRDFAHYNKMYGTLGGVIALMLWLYLSALAILVGGELNAELLKAKGKQLPVKEPDRLPILERRSGMERRAA